MKANQLTACAAAATAVILPGISQAAIDLTGATAAITDGETAVATIGLAVLVMVIGMRVWKRLRGVA